MQTDSIRRRAGWFAATIGGAIIARAAVRRSRRLNLHDKTIIVTGGSRGLGLAISRELVRHGAKLAICSRTADQVERAQIHLAARGGDVLAIPCDITDDADRSQFLRRVRERFGAVDCLINCAGVISVGPAEDAILGDYETAMNTHFWAPLKLTLDVLPEMKHRKRGRIVNIASIGGKLATPHLVPYSASKFALVGLSEGLRAELSRDGISVTTVCPGLIRTGSPRNVPFKGHRKAEYEWFATGAVMPMLSIDPARLARKIVDAMAHGDAELIAPSLYRVPAALQGIAPHFMSSLMRLTNSLLPSPAEITTSQPGYAIEAESHGLPAWVRRRNETAALENNEI